MKILLPLVAMTVVHASENVSENSMPNDSVQPKDAVEKMRKLRGPDYYPMPEYAYGDGGPRYDGYDGYDKPGYGYDKPAYGPKYSTGHKCAFGEGEICFSVKFQVKDPETQTVPEAFKELAERITERVRKEEPGTLDYRWFIDEAEKEVTTFEVYKDSETFLFHFLTGFVPNAEALLDLMDVIHVESFDSIFSDEALETIEAVFVGAGFGDDYTEYFTKFAGVTRKPGYGGYDGYNKPGYGYNEPAYGHYGYNEPGYGGYNEPGYGKMYGSEPAYGRKYGKAKKKGKGKKGKAKRKGGKGKKMSYAYNPYNY